MNKIAIIFWEDYLSIAPTIISLAKSFSKENCYVDIYTTTLNKRYPDINFEEKNIKIYTLKESSNANNLIETYINKLLFISKNNKKSSLNVYNFLKNCFKISKEFYFFLQKIKFTNFINKKLENINYTTYIVVDSTGIATLSHKFIKKNTQNIYLLSLEIDEKSLINPILNPYKFFCYNKIKKSLLLVKNIIIQDELRAHILVDEFEYNFNDFKFHILPNSVPKASDFGKSLFLKNKFKIENYIILHIGQISEAALCYEIAISLNSQKKYSLVFHDKKNSNTNDPYIQLIINSTNFPIYFSLTPVEFKELDQIILSASIGILGYSSNYGKNFEIITMASGKLIMLLRLGIPVVVMEFPGIKDLIDKYKCGIVVKKWEEVVPACDIILNNLEFYSKNAIKCFNNEFDFNIYFQTFFQNLKS